MKQFNKDYQLGTESEIESNNMLDAIFMTELKRDADDKANFDFVNDEYRVELKTRINTWYDKDKDIIFIKNRKGKVSAINTLYFDQVKLDKARDNIKNGCTREYYVVWRLMNDDFFYWKMNWTRGTGDNIFHEYKEFYIEDQYRDRGKGYAQDTKVVNVKDCYIEHAFNEE